MKYKGPRIIALVGVAILSNHAKAQSFGSIEAILDKLEQNHKTPAQYDAYSLQGKKFFVSKDAADHSEKHILEFLPNGQIQLVEVIEDKGSKEQFSNIFTGDVVRNHNHISVRADKLEGKKIAVPVVYNLLLNFYKGYWYLVDINTREKWLETKILDKK